MSRYKKWLKKLASLKFAVFVIAALSVLIAVGTIVESKYNAEIAAKTVYKTPLMFGVMGLFAINLTAVLIDRLPWKRRHVPFILAHVGILILLAGAVMTMKLGIDGTLAIGLGQAGRYVQTSDTALYVWSSADGENFSQVYEKKIDFYLTPPTATKPFQISLPAQQIEILEYQAFALPSQQVEVSKSADAGAAIRFLIHNSRVNVNEWLVQSKKGETAHHNFGPAQFHLGKPPKDRKAGEPSNELWLEPLGADKVAYTVFYKDLARKPKVGLLKEGETLPTGWMDLEFRLLRYLPTAQQKTNFKVMQKPTPATTEAIRLRFEGQEHWLALDDIVKFFTKSGVLVFSYRHQRLDIGFDLRLKDFQVGTYQGTMRAASYQSLVAVEAADLGRVPDQLISMNEPLKVKGLTFYQASFQNGPDGKPSASILSVNYDPGRYFKYLGSLILSLGIVWLFYDRRKAASLAARKLNEKL